MGTSLLTGPDFWNRSKFTRISIKTAVLYFDRQIYGRQDQLIIMQLQYLKLNTAVTRDTDSNSLLRVIITALLGTNYRWNFTQYDYIHISNQ